MSDVYEIYYWPKLAGRAEFIRLIFEEAGEKYKDINENIVEFAIKNERQGYPTFAPPVLKKGDFVLSQTPVICKYLGKKFGLFPDNEEDIFHADQLNQTIHDFIGEGALVYHGKNFVASYSTQQEETKPYIAWFLKDRFGPRWLAYLEMALAANGDGKGFAIGKKLTYVDLALLHVLRAAEAQFPEEWNSLHTIPLLKAFKDRMSARPNLAAYFKSDRCRPFEGNSMM